MYIYIYIYVYIYTHTHADVILFPTKDKQNTKQSFNQQFYFYVRRPTQISSQGTGFKLHIKGMGLSYTINIYSASFRFTVENEIENCIIHLRLFVVISTLLHFETTFSCFAILEEEGCTDSESSFSF